MAKERKLRGDVPPKEKKAPSQLLTKEQEEDVRVARKKLQSELLPYHGRESLESPLVVHGKEIPRMRYFLNGSSGRYKVVAVYRTGGAVKRRVVRILIPGSKRRPNDRTVFERMKSMGIPGA